MLLNTSFTSLSVSPSGRYVAAEVRAAGSYVISSIKLWDTTTGTTKLVATFTSGDGDAAIVGWMPGSGAFAYLDRRGYLSIYDIAAGSAHTVLTSVSAAALSPDGKTVALVAESTDADDWVTSYVGTYDVLTGTVVQLASSGDALDDDNVNGSPVWRRDSARFYVSASYAGSPNDGVWELDRTSHAVTRLGIGGWVVAVSPSGTQVLVSRHSYRATDGSWEALGTWTLSTRAWRYLPVGTNADYDADWTGQWRGDGSAIALVRNDGATGSSDLFVARGDGARLRRIARSASGAVWWPGR
jgi:hypothetical protein